MGERHPVPVPAPGGWIKAASGDVGHRAAGNRLEIRIGKKAIGGDKASGLNLLAQSADKKDYFPDYGVAGLAYAYTRSGSAIGIGAQGNRNVTKPALRITARGRAFVIDFADPHGTADILIRDLRGRSILEAAGITDGRFEWTPPEGGERLFFITVRTAGSAAFGKIFTSF